MKSILKNIDHAHAIDEFNGPRGAFITGSDFLMDGGATASYFYGPLKPNK